MKVIVAVLLIVILDLKTIDADLEDVKPHEVSKEEEEKALEAMAIVDKDGDGKISVAELQLLMKKIGKEVSHDEAAKMLKKADIDGNGSVNVSELMQYLKGSVWEEFKKAVDELFPFLDKNNDGS
ncbi:calmodulin-like [Macrosteles quadrilineatus]|uniref:calmodulin-like n=1 Tax=Macrosteles quadrilineatus TaxID=74068 RepID=UPI0023E20451|nr:calmodulin-like [Macrosteles quadrilineatus]